MRSKKYFEASMAVAFTLALLVTSTGAAAQTETVIHTFQSSSKFDGSNPYSTLIADSQGALYGTTREGGKYGFGSVFKLAPPTAPGEPWRDDVLYSFTGGSDGANPWFGSLLLKNGLLYGTTSHGGSANAGVVFELKAGNPWTETVLYSFTGGTDGGTPSSGVIQGDKGVLYGMTFIGGPKKDGVVYRLTHQAGGAWKESVLYTFKGGPSDGYLPMFGLTLDSSGALYGTTAGGGPNDSGCVFQLVPTLHGQWTENILYFFNADLTNGGLPNSGVVFDSAGALYGTTGNGVYGLAGTLFQLSPPSVTGGAWTQNTLYVFPATATDAAGPNGVVFDSTGALYGTSQSGGSYNQCCDGWGAIFKLTPPSTQGGAWTEQVLYSLQGGSDGAGPAAPLVLVGATFYGTTVIGGTPNVGTVFSFAP
jgi:uncharacterized repeat protein (TIGR03803 family)